MVNKLLEAGANVNKTDKSGRTALHWASIQGHLEPTKVLVEKGIDYNKATNGGTTALHLLVDGNHIKCVEVLIDKNNNGGSPLEFESKDEDGKTPMDLAKEKKLKELCFMLKEKRNLAPGEKQIVVSFRQETHSNIPM